MRAAALAQRTAAQDAAACLRVLADGSKTFALAARLLPNTLRHDFAAIYAFCREADDAVDLAEDPAAGLACQRQRLAQVADAQDPAQLKDATCRALARTLRRHALSPIPLQALLEGFAWDAEGRTYANLRATLAYAARAAGSVGVLLAQLMGVRDAAALARASDMGVAMQLTNIARDVGEDARNGRVYLPATWLAAAGVPPTALGRTPHPHPALSQVVLRLLTVADHLYARARLGLAALPARPRYAVAAAARLYAAIGGVIRRRGGDSVTVRAVLAWPQKLAWLGCGIGDAASASFGRRQLPARRGPLAACAFLLPPNAR